MGCWPWGRVERGGGAQGIPSTELWYKRAHDCVDQGRTVWLELHASEPLRCEDAHQRWCGRGMYGLRSSGSYSDALGRG
jgi:hypothetical protein